LSESRAAAERLQAIVERLGRGLHLPSVSACVAAADQIGRPEAPAAVPDARTLDQIKEDIRQAWKAHGPDSLDVARCRNVPLVLWYRAADDPGDSRGLELSAEIPALWPGFLSLAHQHERLLLYAIDAWLRDFNPTTVGLLAAGAEIAGRLNVTQHPRLLTWAAAHRRFGLFYAGASPRQIATALLDLSSTVDATLKAACLDSPLRLQTNYFRVCLIELLRLTPGELMKPSASDAFTRVRSVVEIDDTIRDKWGRAAIQRRARFSSMESDIAGGCLLAWAEGRAHPSAPKMGVQNFLLGAIGDPRLRPQRWRDVDPRLSQVMRRWVSEQNLEAFLSLIREDDDTLQWQYREAFWRGCFRKVQDAEVWVILGKDIASRAKGMAELQGDFGRMNSPTQAVLLMRLRNIVFSEWSNIGALRAWDVSDRRCPRLYSTEEYPQHTLKARCLEFPDENGMVPRGAGIEGNGLRHDSPQRGLWQKRAAHLLRRKTGVELNHRDYMLKNVHR
jgi:hypothetical protein